MYPSWRPGCGRGADPGLREAFAGVWGCLSAMLEVFLCPVFASYPAKRAFFVPNNLVSVDSHFGLYKYKQLIIGYINKLLNKKHDRCMMVE